MLHVNLFLETRKVSSDQTHDLKIKVSRGNERFFVTMGIKLRAEQWEDGKVVNHPNKQTLNRNILSMLNAYNEAAYSLRFDEGKLSMAEIKERIKMLVSPTEESTNTRTLVNCAEEYTNKFSKKTTLQIYNNTIVRIKQFGDAAIDNINVAWLNSFDKWLVSYCPKKNARNIHLRNIRAVMNYAIDMEYTTNYPFRRYHITPEQTIHRALTKDELLAIYNAECRIPSMAYQRDMFILSFLLIGINYEDMYNLADIVRGRINYHRSKTNRLYSIKVEPEAMEIIQRYKGKEKLLNCADKFGSSHTMISQANNLLKELLPGISTYYARHSWATIAAQLDIPKETISEALGHSHGSAVTSIYIDFAKHKIDEANRKVIDFVFK